MDNQQLYEKIRQRRKHPNLPVYNWKRRDRHDPKWKAVRRAVWERSGGLCESPETAAPKKAGICRREVEYEVFHLDHIRPLSSGGSNHISNLRVLCPICHGLREDMKHKGMRHRMIKNELFPDGAESLSWE